MILSAVGVVGHPQMLVVVMSGVTAQIDTRFGGAAMAVIRNGHRRIGGVQGERPDGGGQRLMVGDDPEMR